LARSGLAITDMNAEEPKGSFGKIDGYLIPFYDIAGKRRPDMWRIRLRTGDRKYHQPENESPPPYFHPHIDYTQKGRIKLMCEGEKKTASANKFLSNILAVGIGGCWNWKSPESGGDLPMTLHPELIEFFKGSAEIVYVPDADFRTNEQVERACGSLRLACRRAGFRLKIVMLPPHTKGLDDFLMAQPPGTHDAAFWALPQSDGLSLMARTQDTWAAIGMKTHEGKPVMLEYCLIESLSKWDYLIDSYYYDIRSSRHMLKNGDGRFHAINDITIEVLKRHMQRALGMGKIGGEIMTAIMHGLAHTFPKNPLAEYLHSLRWDGTPRFAMLAGKLGVDPAKVNYARHVLQNLVTAACARSLVPGTKYDHCVILEGPQGYGKSMFWKELATLNGECYYAVASISAYSHVIGTRDFLTAGARSIFYDLDELAVLSKSDVNAVKTMLSTTMDSYRPAYGRTDVEVQRAFLCVGTTNSDAYLIDPTGNRRFLPIEVGTDGNKHFEMQWLTINREQLWAEAMHLVSQEHHYWELPEAEQRQAEEEQEARSVEDGYTEPIARYLSRAYATNPVERPIVITHQGREVYVYTNTQIYDHLDVPFEKRQGISRRISAIIKNITGGLWRRRTVRLNGVSARGFTLDKEEADKRPRQDQGLPKY
jgi:hypothetical protein